MTVLQQRTCVLVVGMHRSGTSAITGSLRFAGIALGDNLLAPGEDNPSGYFEHTDAVAIDDVLLDALDRRWDDIRPMPENWSRSSAADRAREALKTLIQQSFADEPLFAIKDPRMCRVLPVWIDALEALSISPKILFVVRDPLEVSASIGRRDGWSEAVSCTLWLDYMLDAEHFSRGWPRASVTYDKFLRFPGDVLSTAFEQLGLSFAAQRIGSADLSGFVSKDQRHHFGGTGPSGEIGKLARKAFAVFEMYGQDPGRLAAEFDLLQVEFDRLLAPARDHVEGLSKMLLNCRRTSDALQVQLATRQTELNAQLEWSEAAVKEREALQSEISDLNSRLQAQIDWSNAAVEKENQMHLILHAENQRNEVLSEKLTGLDGALNLAIQKQNSLQERIGRHESTWLGRLNCWYVKKLTPEEPVKETE